MSAEDLDSQFVFLWIAFNAAYANDIPDQYRLGEQQQFRAFISRLFSLDTGAKLDKLIWQSFSGPVRILLDNEFVFQPYWDHLNGQLAESEWLRQFEGAKRAASVALGKSDTPEVLTIVLSRIYTLRNQFLHGGATWRSSVNRCQIQDCAKIMRTLVPIIIEIMMDNAQKIWGDPYYPVV